MTPPEEHNSFPVTDFEVMEIYKLPEKEFKIIILSKLSMIQENTDNKLSKAMHE